MMKGGMKDQMKDTNPKTLVGRSKPDFSLIPPVANAHMADAFMDGAGKYGPYNWREKTVSLRTYIAAAQRHLAQFLDGEQVASDSQVHHLGHVMACCAIMLDAMSIKNAIDDRPVPGAVGSTIASINKRRCPGIEMTEEATDGRGFGSTGCGPVVEREVAGQGYPTTGMAFRGSY